VINLHPPLIPAKDVTKDEAETRLIAQVHEAISSVLEQ